MRNKLKHVGSRDTLPKKSFGKKVNESPKSKNFRSSRYYKPVKSNSRIGSLKRQKESINNLNNSKSSKRYGSVPKHLLNNNSKFYKIYKNQSNDQSYIIKPQNEAIILNNSFPSIK
mmetsp:Transcript_27529/g.24403  ORF Transcript_27529/g.24403 Transcript_27529/m.24403 type:complete len:116 (+) Transcript_27529:363-710(+)